MPGLGDVGVAAEDAVAVLDQKGPTVPPAQPAQEGLDTILVGDGVPEASVNGERIGGNAPEGQQQEQPQPATE